MATPATRVPRIPIEDEAGLQAFLRAHGRAVVLFCGEQCPYSDVFEDAFHARAGQAPGWAFAMKTVEHAGEGPHGERHAIDVTPTLVAYRDARPVSRLEAKVLVGIAPRRFEEWLRTLAE